MAFTAKDVQALRERTGCGMMDCKKALTQSEGDMDKAIELLREKGLAAAEKKAGRIAAEGLVYATNDANVGVVIEVNAETDFVAKNDSFVQFVKTCADVVAKQNPADVDALLQCKADGSNDTVEEMLREKILTIGENMKIRRFAREEGVTCTYMHGAGRIGVMVKFDTTPEIAAKDEFVAYAKDVAMQVAASIPSYVGKEDVPEAVVAKEREILTAQAINEGKPANIAEKMVNGRISKYYKEVCLLEQPFIKDGDITVAKYTENTGKELGGDIKVLSFVRFEKGEGLEKREDNFADEVASMMN
ncbi:translation elongation factor Ts [Candidatus Soleaferrea massiliensis]|uniref:translation elongation factor Ts n=1 Tax=Candidatus Soleaferrea massiliensis TaxID=1470354 RepID=UPI00058DB58D|nr:translation elongation factor Ts [Candidatus Soleaferrea massiliensis]